MTRAILIKTLRDALFIGGLCGLGIFLLEMLFVIVMQDFIGEMEYLWINKEIFQRFARMLLGEELGEAITPTGLITIGFAHPLLFAMSWSFLLVVCTRVTVAEIEWGTADLLFTLPVNRREVYVSASIGWMVFAGPLFGVMLGGTFLGELIAPLDEPLAFDALVKLAVNFVALWLCIGCVTMCVASFSSRRGQAIGAVLVWLLLSFLLNFLSQYWSAIEDFSKIGLLYYYRPLPVIRTNAWPLVDIGILVALGAIAWTIGLVRFCRRDIPVA